MDSESTGPDDALSYGEVEHLADLEREGVEPGRVSVPSRGQGDAMSSESVRPEDTVSYDEIEDRLDRDRDGVSSYRDVEAEAGDEEEVDDEFDLDQEAVREAGADLDRLGGETPRLD
jgi:hypothetical protein